MSGTREEINFDRNVEILQDIRRQVNWENETSRREFLRHFYLLIGVWGDRYPDLQRIFLPHEIECILFDSLSFRGKNHFINAGDKIIEFVARSGYKDKGPKIDEDGNPVLLRTTPVHRATGCNSFVIVNNLFEIYDRYDLNYIDEESGLTHFHLACMFDCDVVVKKYLEFGQDPDCLVRTTGDSSLLMVLRENNRTLVRLLLSKNANPNLANLDGNTPLHIICRGPNSYNMAKLLFRISHIKRRSLEINARDRGGNTPLHWALINGLKLVAEFLLRKGADPNLINVEGFTSLHVICLRGFGELEDEGLVELFFRIIDEIEKTVQVDARDILGRTPLQLAVINFLPHVVDVLLDRGADLSNFFFPSESHFNERLKIFCTIWSHFQLRLAACFLGTIERLEIRGYELNKNEALLIMKLFDKYGLFKNTVELDKRWCYNWSFGAKRHMMKPGLSLWKLIWLKPKATQILLTYMDYLRYLPQYRNFYLPHNPDEVCTMHLCEKLSRRFFWNRALYAFWKLLGYQLPLICCETIFDNLMNKDLWRICLAANM